MPSDALCGNKYKYILLGIDVASRYKAGTQLRMKQAKDIADMIVYIYKVGPLTYPEVFQCENGSELKAEVPNMLKKHGVKIRHTVRKYKHRHTAFVKALNKPLAENLFSVQDTQELNDPEKVLIDQLNDMKIQMTGMKPKEAIKLKKVPLAESYPPEDTLPEDGLYCYLLQPAKEHDNQCKRATDRIWSERTYRLSEVLSSPGNQVMYYLADGLKKTFIKEELMLIPEDTELPPDFVQKW